MEKCRLCGQEAKLEISHIIPHFVHRWLKTTSISKLRSGSEPNRPIQDGIKIQLLCRDCEALFSTWEDMFAKEIFFPFHKLSSNEKFSLPYRDWCLKFAVSISWRILQFNLETGKLDGISTEQYCWINSAQNKWKDFLLGTSPDPGEYEQHILPVESITNSNLPIKLSPFMNRYLIRSYDSTIGLSDKGIIAYSKIGRILIFGFIKELNPNSWKRTMIHVSHGTFSTGIYEIPANIIHFINSRANGISSILSGMSEIQKGKIDKFSLENIFKFEDSEVWFAINKDYSMFGEDIFK